MSDSRKSESKKSRSKKIILLAFVSALIGWPPIHMGLSIHHGFSSWKFAGWGMYATPFDLKTESLQVYLVPRKIPKAWRESREPWLPPVRVEGGFEVYHWNSKKLEFRLVGGHQSDPSVIQSGVNKLKVFGSTASVEGLGRSIVDTANFPERAPKLFFFVIQPRLHPLQRIAYAEVNAYVFQRGRARKVGTFHTDEKEIEEVFLSMMKGQDF